MDPQTPRRARCDSWCEPMDSASDNDLYDDDEDGSSVHTSDLDSAHSGDEANFTEGTAPSCDIDEEETELEPTCNLEGGNERKRSQPPANREKPSKSETLSGEKVMWKNEKQPDSLPCSPPHFLPKRKPGVQSPISEYTHLPSPLELFKMYLDPAAINVLCVNTNKNAAKNIAAGKKFRWIDVTQAEMHQYIGLTLFMGVLRLPKLRDFWRTGSIFHVPYPCKVMSRDRFFAITCNIHMSDPLDDAINDSKKGTVGYDFLHRLRPLYDSLRIACKTVYHPQKNLSVGVHVVSPKTRVAMKQYVKNKATKQEVKFVVLSDNTGYITDFSIYIGKSTLVSGKGLLFDIVLALFNKAYLGSGYHVYCNSFCTSPALFLHLYVLGFGACGTLQDATVGVPKSKVNAVAKNSPRGTIRWIREGPLLFVKWMDVEEVSVCSTLHTAFSGDTVKRVKKHESVKVPVPRAVKDYNLFMGGDDLSDQLINTCSSWRKSRKWYLSALRLFIDIAVTNSYLLHKELCGKLEQQATTRQAFQEQLAAELCGVPFRDPASDRHLPVAIVEGASGPRKTTQGRRKCKLCGKCTPFMCDACQVALCVIVDRNCHKSYHVSGGGVD